MCGIFGVGFNSEAAKIARLGVLNLQHRGQDTAGLTVLYNNRFQSLHGLGLVDTAIPESDLESLVKSTDSRTAAIAHVRYTTSGKHKQGLYFYAQPLTTDFGIAMAHNGNIINKSFLEEWLINRGVYLNTPVDVEPLMKVFAVNLTHNKLKDRPNYEAVFQALKRTFNIVKGSYSAIALLSLDNNPALLAFKDPQGFMPLAMGVDDNGSIAFSSESIALEKTGFEYIKELSNGEAFLVVNQNDKIVTYDRLILQQDYTPCIFQLIYFANPASVVFNQDVQGFRKNLGKILAEEWLSHSLKQGLKADIVCAAPSTAVDAALEFSKSTGIAFEDVIKRHSYIGRTFIMSNQTDRELAAKIKLQVTGGVMGKRVVVIDDSIVRGTTSKRIVKELRNKGASKVYFISTAPPIIKPCVYGIDMTVPDELIASKKDVENVRRSIGADFLLYMPLDRLKEAVNKRLRTINFCDACFSGVYPLKITNKELDELVIDRLEASEEPNDKN